MLLGFLIDDAAAEIDPIRHGVFIFGSAKHG